MVLVREIRPAVEPIAPPGRLPPPARHRPSSGATMHVLLSGTVGSTAYGLAHKGSDIDRLGVFAAPTEAFHVTRL
ncbi:hypothetical protein GCM10009753_52280 [Streptantibioticus ferralitis]